MLEIKIYIYPSPLKMLVLKIMGSLTIMVIKVYKRARPQRILLEEKELVKMMIF